MEERKAEWHPNDGSLYVRIKDQVAVGEVAHSVEVETAIVLDYDSNDDLVGVEIIFKPERRKYKRS